jgi:hypothetical protein
MPRLRDSQPNRTSAPDWKTSLWKVSGKVTAIALQRLDLSFTDAQMDGHHFEEVL